MAARAYERKTTSDARGDTYFYAWGALFIIVGCINRRYYTRPPTTERAVTQNGEPTGAANLFYHVPACLRIMALTGVVTTISHPAATTRDALTHGASDVAAVANN